MILKGQANIFYQLAAVHLWSWKQRDKYASKDDS